MHINDLTILIGVITLGFILWNLWVSIRIVKYLNENNVKAKIAHQRGKIFSFLSIYKKLTVEQNGKVGSLYRLFFISFILFALFLLIGITLVAL